MPTDFDLYLTGLQKFSLMIGLTNETYNGINNLNDWIDHILDKK